MASSGLGVSLGGFLKAEIAARQYGGSECSMKNLVELEEQRHKAAWWRKVNLALFIGWWIVRLLLQRVDSVMKRRKTVLYKYLC